MSSLIDNKSELKNLDEFILHEGLLKQVQDFSLPGLNTGLLFGETAFVSFRTLDSNVATFGKHMERLVKSAEFVDFQMDLDIWKKIDYSLQELFEDCPNHYFRVTLYSELDGRVGFFVWVRPLGKGVNTPVTLKTMEVERPLFFHEVKLGQYAEIFRIGRRAKVLFPEFDEILLVNNEEEVYEAATSNFFCVSNKKIITPSFESGVYQGIFISEFLRYSNDLRLSREIKNLFLKEVLENDYTCFISNSVKGVRLVTQIDESKLNYKQEDIDFVNEYLEKVGGHEQVTSS